jgi:hypothetical protein
MPFPLILIQLFLQLEVDSLQSNGLVWSPLPFGGMAFRFHG